jgi:hypothetical protein
MKIEDEIEYSQEELLYLLRTLNLPDMPGMGDQPWGHIPQENALLVMETVGRSLVARQTIRFEQTQMVVNDKTAKFLKACVYPEQMLALTYNQDGNTINQNFFRGPEFDVEHTQPYPWVHHFKVMPKSDMGFGLIQSILSDAPNGESSPVFQVDQARLDQIRQMANHDVMLASQHLAEAGLAAPLSEKLAHALASPQIKLLLIAVYDLGEDVQQNMFSIFADDQSCWLIGAGQPGSPMAQIMQLGHKKQHEIIQATFLPFQKH